MNFMKKKPYIKRRTYISLIYSTVSLHLLLRIFIAHQTLIFSRINNDTHLKKDNDIQIFLCKVVKIFIENEQLFPHWKD